MPATPAGDALVQSPANFVPAGHGAGSSRVNANGTLAQEDTLASLGLKLSREEIVGSRRGLDEHISAQSLRSIRSGLPPTPPSQNGEGFDEPLLSPSMLSEVYQDALSSPRMQVSTPVQLTGPPTPDTTPPSTRDRLNVPKKGLYHFPSLSQAESFVTARETLRSQASNRSQSYQSVSNKSSRQLSNSTPGVGESNKLDGAHASITPRMNGIARQQDVSPSPRSRKSHQSSASDVDASQTTMKKHTGNLPNGHLTPDHPSAHSRNSSITSTYKSDVSPRRKPRHRRQHEGQTPSDRSKDSLRQQEANNPNSSHDALYTHLRDEKSKRLSAHSITSTVVEAIVYTSPQKPHRGLRHAGKNLALRSDAKELQQNRCNFSDTTGLHEHRLRHRKTPLPGRGFGMGHLNHDEEKPRAFSTPEALRKEPARASEPSLDSSPRFASRTLSKPAKRLTPPDWPLRVTNDSSAQSEQSEQEDDQSVRSVQRGLVPRGPPVELTDDEDDVSGKQDSSPDMHFSKPGWRRGGNDDELASPPLKPPTSYGMLRARNDSLDVDENKLHPFRTHSGSDGGVTRGSLDGSRRGSLDPRLDHAHAQHLTSAHTPMSEQSAWSDRTHTAEVNQARAVNIYPHHNGSLLLVQHPNPMPSLPHDFPSPEETSSLPRVPKFEAFLDTGTPPPDSPATSKQHHSPLTNPRTAPAPPVIQFIPATPASEPDRQLTDSPGAKEPFSMNSTAPLPVRRASLRERARAQSVALVDAILLRNPSVRSRPRRRNTVSEERPRNLDPFWRPRGFWEDFDSDEEDVEPLPRGGDESDLEPEEDEGRGGKGNGGKGMFPRKMSVRLPRGMGMRLSGGRSFVPGQDGTVALGVRKRRSEKALRTGRALTLGKGKLGLVGVKVRGLREWGGRIREGREERLREKRREKIRGSIGQRWLMESSRAV
ncbi:Hypothetical protein D9617_9g025500 [Elsinoe fawcettii]|nr:Hypothetical protein D9617_9g025500 [Elsinoe fawcettii]